MLYAEGRYVYESGSRLYIVTMMLVYVGKGYCASLGSTQPPTLCRAILLVTFVGKPVEHDRAKRKGLRVFSFRQCIGNPALHMYT